ncbi:uncharacterized protein VTP21DRAFT_1735 [Calcarisporiella thermophila]|uniref:uncharacterized protein n=1 Tax=Calcarisporiella thermophila TaxID=911321 RepID=UPI003742F01D
MTDPTNSSNTLLAVEAENSRNIDTESQRQAEENKEAIYTPINSPNPIAANDGDLKGLLENNRNWAFTLQKQRPTLFQEMARGQQPKILWIGCSDSRVPSDQIVQTSPGELFVHRNIANVVTSTDLSALSVIQYAVEVLKVEHIIVCGHYKCGGCIAALQNKQYGLIDNWLRTIKDVYKAHASELESLDPASRERRLIELNTMRSVEQVAHTGFVQDAWHRGQRVYLHAWCYDVETGLIRDLESTIFGPEQVNKIFNCLPSHAATAN